MAQTGVALPRGGHGGGVATGARRVGTDGTVVVGRVSRVRAKRVSVGVDVGRVGGGPVRYAAVCRLGQGRLRGARGGRGARSAADSSRPLHGGQCARRVGAAGYLCVCGHRRAHTRWRRGGAAGGGGAADGGGGPLGRSNYSSRPGRSALRRP
eukprot:ctg_1193.g374